MDRATVKRIASEVEAAVAEVAKRNNVSISYAGGRYDSTSATIKLQVADIAENGKVLTQEATDFTRFAALFNLKPEELGKVFASGGDRFEIIGLKPNAHKYPVLARKITTNRVFKFPAERVRSALDFASNR